MKELHSSVENMVVGEEAELADTSPVLEKVMNMAELLHDDISGEEQSIGRRIRVTMITDAIEPDHHEELNRVSKVLEITGDEVDVLVLRDELQTDDMVMDQGLLINNMAQTVHLNLFDVEVGRDIRITMLAEVAETMEMAAGQG